MPTELTPAKVLTKGQLKRAARDNKGRTKNVLFNPFSVQWPPVEEASAAAVLAALRSQLQQFHVQSAMPQDEYAALLAAGDRAAIGRRRRQLRAAAEPLLAARRRHLEHCVLGFNAASRALECGRLAALLVEADTPALETRLLVPLAAGRRCPAVCLPRVREVVQRRIGLSTAVLGLLQGATADGHHLKPLYDAICRAAVPLIWPRPAAAAAAVAPESPEAPESGLQGGPGCDGPVVLRAPFEQADFISLSVSPPQSAADDLVTVDTEGVPHKKRLALKQARVMSVTLGSKALKKAVKVKKATT
ncbi:hypothetical protein FJT64_012059 [Amphibalanus amphitrite]|uniref:Uncharacterized protein n=1 Tax=Amphibalanus amphitrite TaxID=1232801 RepID=A0A6A4VGR2_AMPAM|nr:hypothetical protein FJT64_012059 [Amphibalanus amphitrite]